MLHPGMTMPPGMPLPGMPRSGMMDMRPGAPLPMFGPPGSAGPPQLQFAPHFGSMPVGMPAGVLHPGGAPVQGYAGEPLVTE